MLSCKCLDMMWYMMYTNHHKKSSMCHSNCPNSQSNLSYNFLYNHFHKCYYNLYSNFLYNHYHNHQYKLTSKFPCSHCHNHQYM